MIWTLPVQNYNVNIKVSTISFKTFYNYQQLSYRIANIFDSCMLGLYSVLIKKKRKRSALIVMTTAKRSHAAFHYLHQNKACYSKTKPTTITLSLPSRGNANVIFIAELQRNTMWQVRLVRGDDYISDESNARSSGAISAWNASSSEGQQWTFTSCHWHNAFLWTRNELTSKNTATSADEMHSPLATYFLLPVNLKVFRC